MSDPSCCAVSHCSRDPCCRGSGRTRPNVQTRDVKRRIECFGQCWPKYCCMLTYLSEFLTSDHSNGQPLSTDARDHSCLRMKAPKGGTIPRYPRSVHSATSMRFYPEWYSLYLSHHDRGARVLTFLATTCMLVSTAAFAVGCIQGGLRVAILGCFALTLFGKI